MTIIRKKHIAERAFSWCANFFQFSDWITLAVQKTPDLRWNEQTFVVLEQNWCDKLFFKKVIYIFVIPYFLQHASWTLKWKNIFLKIPDWVLGIQNFFARSIILKTFVGRVRVGVSPRCWRGGSWGQHATNQLNGLHLQAKMRATRKAKWAIEFVAFSSKWWSEQHHESEYSCEIWHRFIWLRWA